MADIRLSDSIGSIAHHSGPLAVLAGAGISTWHPADMPMADELKRRVTAGILNQLSHKEIRVQFQAASESMPLEKFITAIGWGVESCLEEIYSRESAAPNAWHELIADGVKDGKVKVVFTTNFDKLLRKALGTRGFNPSLHTHNMLETYEFGADEDPVNPSSPTIYHLHGTYEAWNMCVTYQHMIDPSVSRRRLEPLIRFLERDSALLLVLGYSARDPDFSLVIPTITGRNGHVVFVRVDSDSEQVKEEIRNGCFRGFELSIVSAATFDQAVAVLRKALVGGEMVARLTSEESPPWNETVDRWANRLPKCAPENIASRIVKWVAEEPAFWTRFEQLQERRIRLGSWDVWIRGDIVGICPKDECLITSISSANPNNGLLLWNFFVRRLRVLGYLSPLQPEPQIIKRLPNRLCEPREFELLHYVNDLLAAEREGELQVDSPARQEFLKTAGEILSSHSFLHRLIET